MRLSTGLEIHTYSWFILKSVLVFSSIVYLSIFLFSWNVGVYEYKEMLQDAVKPKIEDITLASDEEFKELLGEMQKQKDAKQK